MKGRASGNPEALLARLWLINDQRLGRMIGGDCPNTCLNNFTVRVPLAIECNRRGQAGPIDDTLRPLLLDILFL